MAKKKSEATESPIQYRPGRLLAMWIQRYAGPHRVSKHETARRFAALGYALRSIDPGFYNEVRELTQRTGLDWPEAVIQALSHRRGNNPDGQEET